METIGIIIKQALVQHKSMLEIQEELAHVLDSHLPGFSAAYKERITLAVTSNQALLNLKSLAREQLIFQQKHIAHFVEELNHASQFIGIGDHAFPRYEAIYTRIHQDIDALECSFEEIRHQIELTRSFITLHDTPKDTRPSIKHTSFMPQVPQKKNNIRPKQRSHEQTVEKISTPGLISRLSKLGFQIIQPGVIKKFEKLNDIEKMKLAQYLTTVESYAGSLRTSPYITSLKGIPYLALKFSYGTSAYRIICHKDTHEITDVCHHDEYQKNYLIS